MLFFRGVSIYLKFQSQIFGIWTKHRQICKSRLLRKQQDARGTSQHSAFPQKHHAGLQVAQTNEDGCALPGSKEKQRNPKVFFEKTAPSSLKLKWFGILLLNLAGNIEHTIYPPWNETFAPEKMAGPKRKGESLPFPSIFRGRRGV